METLPTEPSAQSSLQISFIRILQEIVLQRDILETWFWILLYSVIILLTSGSTLLEGLPMTCPPASYDRHLRSSVIWRLRVAVAWCRLDSRCVDGSIGKASANGCCRSKSLKFNYLKGNYLPTSNIIRYLILFLATHLQLLL